MTDQLALDLVEKHLITDQIVLTVGYDTMNLSDPVRRQKYSGPVHTDHYGRQVPKEAHGSFNLPRYTSSARILTESMEQLFNRRVNPDLLIRRITVVANHVIDESKAPVSASNDQPDLFTDYEAVATEDGVSVTANDLVFAEVHLLDAAGHPAHGADIELKLTAENAQITGPAVKRTEAGIVSFLLRITATGKVKVTASAAGLPDAGMEITVPAE